MQSMTGYSFVEDKCEQFSYSMEIRTLNNKYNELYVNLPRFLRPEEMELQNRVKESFSRGKIELTIDVFDWTVNREMTINHGVAEACYREIKLLERNLGDGVKFSPDILFQFDGVLNKSRSILSVKSRKKLHDTLQTAIKKCNLMRNKEGLALKKDIADALKAIKLSVKKIQNLSKFDSRKHYDKLKERIASLADTSVDEKRLFSEVAFYADKIDINEELCRLSDHLEKFDKLMESKDAVGKKIDFLAQELFREINTMGSKTASSEVSHIVVEMKNHVDRIREQARNLV